MKERVLKVGDIVKIEIATKGKKGDGIGFLNTFAVIVTGDTEINNSYKVEITKVMDKYAFAILI